jgi:hypothetical protein
MLDEYQMDPAFNKDLVFAYQPPPEIDAAKLPILIENWLEDLQEIICEADSRLPKNIFDKLFRKTSEYRIKPLLKQLELIYHRLQGNLDAELGKLSRDKRQAIISKLTEEIIHCSEGFHNRVNIIVDSFLKPRNLAELLYTVRKELVEEVAATLTNEVHAWNRVSVIAANDGLGVKANFPDDPYSGALSATSIRRALQQTFYKKFTPFHLPCLLTNAFKEFIPELESEKNNEHGICLQTQKKITTLIRRFLPKYINEKPDDPNNWKNYFKVFRNKKDSLIFSFVNLDWEKIYRSFYSALSEQKYFINPQKNTLMGYAYDNLFITKNSSDGPNRFISRLFKEEKYSDLLEQLVELNTRFPNYYQKVSKNKVFTNNCLVFIDYLTRQLKISSEYSAEVMQGFQLIIRLDLRRKNFIIEKIANTFLLKNQAGFNLFMLAAQYNPTLADDILVFLKTNGKIIDAALIEKMFLMKNKDNSNVLMIAASKQAEAIVSILNFLTTHIGRFANDTLRMLFTQQQKDSYGAVTLTARDHPDRVKNILSFITDHIKIDGEILRKLLFSENSNGACTALMVATKNQSDATFSILKFISENIKKFDPEILRKIFLEKDQDDFTILMLAARYQPKALRFLLTFINDFDEFFPVENLPTLFLEKNPENNNCLMLAAEFQPISVSTILNFITNKIENFKPYLVEILFAKNKKGYNSLMLTRHHPEAMASLINFINAQPKTVISLTLEEIFLEKHDLGFTILMLTARDRAKSLKLILDFIDKKPTLFAGENVVKLIFDLNELKYNSLMLAARNQCDGVGYILNFIQSHTDVFSPTLIKKLLLAHDIKKISTLMIAARYQPEAAKFILNFIQKQPEIFLPSFLNEFLLAHDEYGVNALMTAATYQINVVKLLLDFLASNIKHFTNDEIYKFVFKDIHDKDAANAIFFGGRYNFRKSIMSVTAQLKDPAAISVLLRFVDDHIQLLGMQILAKLLTEKDNQDNYVFRSACSRYISTMKKVLNFLADSTNSQDLAPIQDLSAYFIFEQFSRWQIKTDHDHNLLNKVILNCSALLLIYFNKDYFSEQPNNLKIVTDKLFSCYLNELIDRRAKKVTYTTKFSFFKWRYSTAQKLEAAQSLEKVLATKDVDKGPALQRLKASYPAISTSRLGNLFAAYQEIDKLKANDVCVDVKNDAMHSSLTMSVA